MTVSAQATWVAGLLAADGVLRPDLDSETVRGAVARLASLASVWGTTVPAEEGWGPFEDAVAGSPPAWAAPDPSLVDAVADALEAGWSPVDRLLNRPIYIEPMLRVVVHSIDDAHALRTIEPPAGLHVSGFIPAALGAWTWRWPLRVGVISPTGPSLIDEMRGVQQYGDLYEIVGMHAGDQRPRDIVVLDPALARSVRPDDIGPVGAVMVLGEDGGATGRGLHLGTSIPSGAIVELPNRDVSWFEDLVRELSHDRPLDAALALAVPGAVMVADPEFVAATSLRNWLRLVAERAHDDGEPALSRELFSILEHHRFDHETGGGRDSGAAIEAAEAGGSQIEIGSEAGTRSAGPVGLPLGVGSPTPGSAAPSSPPRSAAPPAAVPAAEDDGSQDRRLVSRVTDARGEVCDRGFRRGRVHRLSLRIARGAGAGEFATEAPVASPTPGVDADLVVTVLVDGAMRSLAPVAMRYPAAGDGDWTAPISFTAPRRAGSLRLFITVQHRGRVILSAILSGPLRSGQGRGGPMELVIDESAGIDDPNERVAADATFMQVPGRGDRPVVIDANSTVAIDQQTLAKANNRVRKSLIDAFLDPPGSLADAAPVLEDLAVRGSLLRDALRGKDTSFFDDAPWIHVTSFGGPPVYFELIYTHPMPRTHPVAVCGPALAGETGCANDCPDRERDDRVCPFGFWGTTKVVERRLHSPERHDSSTSEHRIISIQRGGVVAVTDLANADDPGASRRIVDAVTSFVEAGSAIEAADWSELEAALVARRDLLCLVTHTVEPDDPDDDLGIELQLGSESQKLHLIDDRYINPDRRAPGPVVLALGCDTGTISASFASFVSRLHSLGAEIVVSAIAQIPGKEVADFVERFAVQLDEQLKQPGAHRFGEVMTATRAETLRQGDVLALALTASGDGDVQLVGRA